MSVVFFSTDEASFLKGILEERKKDVEGDITHFIQSDINFYYAPVVSCIEKLKSGGVDNFSKREVEIIKSCITDKYDSLSGKNEGFEDESVKNTISSVMLKIK
ncbi:MAG: hypothetical protein IPK31_19165 [Chitinophagaceae bacterium]|nr:hypothetical protein [Chitinophagaceae bacterium]